MEFCDTLEQIIKRKEWEVPWRIAQVWFRAGLHTKEAIIHFYITEEKIIVFLERTRNSISYLYRLRNTFTPIHLKKCFTDKKVLILLPSRKSRYLGDQEPTFQSPALWRPTPSSPSHPSSSSCSQTARCHPEREEWLPKHASPGHVLSSLPLLVLPGDLDLEDEAKYFRNT